MSVSDSEPGLGPLLSPRSGEGTELQLLKVRPSAPPPHWLTPSPSQGSWPGLFSRSPHYCPPGRPTAALGVLSTWWFSVHLTPAPDYNLRHTVCLPAVSTAPWYRAGAQ